MLDVLARKPTISLPARWGFFYNCSVVYIVTNLLYALPNHIPFTINRYTSLFARICLSMRCHDVFVQSSRDDRNANPVLSKNASHDLCERGQRQAASCRPASYQLL